jgi:DNA-binding MarR family transcriptional regulator
VTPEELDRACRRMGATCACFHLRRAARAVTQRYDRALADTGLKATHLTILSALQLHAGIRMADLAEVLVLEASALSRNLSLLRKKRLVKTTTTDDRRARAVHLTDAGRAALAKAYPAWATAQAALESAVPAPEVKAALRFLDDVTTHALATTPPPRRALPARRAGAR